MPHHPEDERHPHLPLVRVEENPPRRKRPGFGAPRPARGERAAFGEVLLTKVDEIETEARRIPAVEGFAPHLVFRVPLAEKAPVDMVADKLRNAGLTVVSIEPDQAVVVFQDDANLRGLPPRAWRVHGRPENHRRDRRAGKDNAVGRV